MDCLQTKAVHFLYKKKYKKIKKRLALQNKFVYTDNCCDMIAMKREVAACKAGFPWSECQVRKLTTSHCTSSETINGMDVCKEVERHTRRCVQSPLVVLHN